jgi:YD repeat-containing protein
VAFTFDTIFAADPSNSTNAASNAAITIFNPADPGKAPVTITDVSGSPLPNPITVNKNGFGPAFQHATLDRLAWSGGGFEGYFTSYEGLKQVALDAQAAAETAATSAATAEAAAQEASSDLLPANPDLSVTYNPDGSVASTTENGVVTTFTYNADGTVDTQTRNGVTKTFSYDANGNVTGAA